MVNTGRPSPGCATCKTRKIKCDLLRPACSPCLKSRWTCPGVPSQADVVFRRQLPSEDDAATTTTRSSSRRYNLQGRAGYKSKQDQEQDGGRLRSLSCPLEDRATAFFVHQYVFEGGGGVEHPTQRGGLHEYIPELLEHRRQPKGDNVLASITAAAGLAALANAGSSAPWRAEAYRWYGKAIRQLKENLADQQLVKADQTLAAVMLMGMFEVIACGDLDSMKSFGHHTLAAARCIEVRGPQQFAAGGGVLDVRLFVQFRRIIVMTCHQLQEPIPDSLIKCSEWASNSSQINMQTPSNKFYKINERLAAVRAEIKHRAISSPAVISEMLLPIDAVVEEWRRTLPESWLFKSYRCLSPGFTSYTSRYDVYPDLFVASIWNSYRSIRLVIHETIIAATMRHGSREQRQGLGKSMAILRAMADGVCHSVPYHLTFFQPTDVMQRYAVVDAGMQYKSQPFPAPGAYLLFWPLFLSGMLRAVTTQQRHWIASVLEQIGVRMGLKLAISMSEALKCQESTFSASETWFIGEFYPS